MRVKTKGFNNKSLKNAISEIREHKLTEEPSLKSDGSGNWVITFVYGEQFSVDSFYYKNLKLAQEDFSMLVE